MNQAQLHSILEAMGWWRPFGYLDQQPAPNPVAKITAARKSFVATTWQRRNRLEYRAGQEAFRQGYPPHSKIIQSCCHRSHGFKWVVGTLMPIQNI